VRISEHLTTPQSISTATASTSDEKNGNDSKPNESKEETLKRLIYLTLGAYAVGLQ
jgi:hypothetical protein